MRIVIASTMVLVVLLVAWLLFRRTSVGRDPALLAPGAEQVEVGRANATSALESQQGAGDRKAALAGAAPAIASGAAVEAHTLGVRSSIGLFLPFAEWQVDAFDWQRLDLDRGRCAIGPMKLPCLVRAPGHVAALASRAGQELVLEPDALLTLEASDLRDCVSWIRPDRGDPGVRGDQVWDEARVYPPLRRAIAWGWLSDSRWAIAASSELVPEALGTEPVELVVRWRDGRNADIDFLAEAGTRGTWSVPCENRAATAPLDVRVIRPDAAAAGRVALRFWRTDRSSSGASAETHGWGRVVHYPPESFWLHDQVPQDLDSVHFDSVPTGIRFSLAARDETTAAYGRLVFVHDGSARTLELRSGFELAGRIVDAESSAPVTTADVRWVFQDGEGDVWGWRAEAYACALGADGAFVLRGPDNPLVNENTLLVPPSHVLLRVDAAGFEPFEGRFDTGGAIRFDCGEVRLVPRQADIVLAPGHGLTPKAVRWFEVLLSAAPGVFWSVGDAALNSEGELLLFVDRSQKRLELYDTRPGESRAWPGTPSERMLLHVLPGPDDEAWAFERGPDGRYVAVPRHQLEIEVECRAVPGEGEHWRVGWQWHELWSVFEQVPSWRLGQTFRVGFSAPAGGTTLFWSASGDPPKAGNEPGGSLPLTALSGKLVIQ